MSCQPRGTRIAGTRFPNKESSKTNAAKRAPAPQSAREFFAPEEQLEVLTLPKFSWSLGEIQISGPGENGPPPGGNANGPASIPRSFPLAPPMQAKLKVGVTDDPLEREADRVAENVIRMREAKSPATLSSGAFALQRKCDCGGTRDKCKEKDKHQEQAQVRMKATGPGTESGNEAPAIVQEVLRSPGEPLDKATRAFMQPRFGWDFSRVRVHADARAAESAKAVQARAYTVGKDVVFGAGEFSPGSHEGQKLLGHELTHVVQQDALNLGNGPPGATRLQRQPKHAAPTPPAGGNILYIGMSKNSPLEALFLRTAYRGKPVAVTTVTLSDTESKTKTTATGPATFDLTTDDGINAFVSALKLPGPQAKSVGDMMRSVPNVNRDDWAHVLAVYAQTESDGKDRMSRVILSGHSGGVSVYSKENKGEIEFGILASLSGVFPKAAAQTKHLMVAACFAGDEDILLRFYQKAFPNLKTFTGWTWFSPTDKQGARAVTAWAHTTDVDPSNLPAPKSGEATWESGTYHGGNPREAPADAIRSLRFQQQLTFDDYFTGDKVGEKYRGDLPEYYGRALALANRQDITGPDHDYAQIQANRALRLRFWKEQAAGFWAKFGTEIRKGYGSAKVPDYGHLPRKAALEQIAAFPGIAKGTDADKAEAQRLLNALRDLDDPNIMDKTWI